MASDENAGGADPESLTAGAVGLLLAGGSGSRFDPNLLSAKLLARVRVASVDALRTVSSGRPVHSDASFDEVPSDEESSAPVALHAARHLIDATGRALVVIRPEWQDSPTLEPLARSIHEQGLTVTVCADAHLGMGHSLAWGVSQAMTLYRPRALVVALADMPWIRVNTIRQLIDALPSADSIVAPRFAGERGHPVVFGSGHFEALARSTGDRGAGALLSRFAVTYVDVDDEGVLRDIDSPQDLPR